MAVGPRVTDYKANLSAITSLANKYRVSAQVTATTIGSDVQITLVTNAASGAADLASDLTKSIRNRFPGMGVSFVTSDGNRAATISINGDDVGMCYPSLREVVCLPRLYALLFFIWLLGFLVVRSF